MTLGLEIGIWLQAANKPRLITSCYAGTLRADFSTRSRASHLIDFL
jgi:hypothetical protein